MNIHEHQAKKLLKEYGVPVPVGVFGFSVDEILQKSKLLTTEKYVLKAQIHAGGRGAGFFKNSFNDKGGVQVVFDKNQVRKIASSMLGNVLVTKQTGEKVKTVNRIFIEEGCDIVKEFYLSLLFDRNNSKNQKSDSIIHQQSISPLMPAFHLKMQLYTAKSNCMQQNHR